MPGFAPEAVWPQLAEWFRMEPEKLAQLVARAPRTIKQDDDEDKLQKLQAGIAKLGAQTQICAADEQPALYVMVEGAARGPMPRAFVQQRISQGLWTDSIQVCPVGANEWQPYSQSGAAATALSLLPMPVKPAPVAVAAPAQAPDAYARWAPPKAPLVIEGNATVGDGSWNELPAGGAIHAGFWRRFAALVLDGLVLAIPTEIFNKLLPGIVGSLLVIVLRWLYFALQESSAQQATLGKRAMGIKVVNAQGERIGFGRATGRHFGAALSYILCVGFMLAGWTERKQALHDLIAGTFVVFKGVQPAEPLPAKRPPMPWYGWVVNILAMVFLPLAIIGAGALSGYQAYVTKAKMGRATAPAELIQQKTGSPDCAGDLPDKYLPPNCRRPAQR